MRRRAFNQTLASVALGAVALLPRKHDAAAMRPAGDEPAGVPLIFSVMLWTVFRDLPFEQRLEKVVEAGYRSVQLAGEQATWTDEDFRKVNRRRRDLGIGFDGLAGVRHALADPRYREAFLADVQALLPVAEKLDCPAIITTSGNAVPELSREVQHQSIVEGLKRGADITAPKGVTLLLETINPSENPKIYLSSMAECFDIIREVGHPRVKAIYDFYHEQIAAGNLIAKLEKNIDLVSCLHIADVPGRHEPGTGEIHYQNIYRELARLNFHGVVAMEFFPSGDPVECLQKAKEEVVRAWL